MIPSASPPPLFFLLFAIGFPIFLIGMWCLVCTIIAVIGGWTSLAFKFRARGVPTEGPLFSRQSARIGLSNYNQALNVRITPQGLYLWCTPFFRFMHPPLLIPWGEVKGVSKHQILWVTLTKFRIGSPQIASIDIMNTDILEAAQPWLALPAPESQSQAMTNAI